ncbi:MAG: helix-turn-helix domain-containing protein [Planctomycetota bacterium]|nr:helix-turn-helix domain-containing protein [Planctomycetota bacterium]
MRKRLVEEGLDAALDRKKQVRPSIEKIFDGEKEAKLIAIACGPKPKGRTRWTQKLLADRVVALKIVEHCSRQTVMRVLRKDELKPWQRKMWCISSQCDAECVCDGKRAGGVQAAVGSIASGRLLRREEQATGQRGCHADSCCHRPRRMSRL